RQTVCVDVASPVEIRRLELTNDSNRSRTIELTSFLEVVLNQVDADRAHPAFSNLFVQTEFVAEPGALLARRRPRGPDERHPWLVHTLRWHSGAPRSALEHETDRARFLGRGRDPSFPRALASNHRLSGTTGNVLDPAFSLRQVVEIAPGQTVAADFLLGAASSREEALALVESRDSGADFATLEESHARERLEALGITDVQAERHQALAGALLRGDPAVRAPREMLARAHGDPASLPRHGIDGRPLVVLDVRRPDVARSLFEALRMRRYWHAVGLDTQLLVLSDDPSLDSIADREGGGVLVQRVAHLPAADLDLIATAADLWIGEPPAPLSLGVAAAADNRALGSDVAARERSATHGEPLRHFNGIGGFTADGREYVIRLELDGGSLRRPPMPWINVVANESFGFLASETGAGYTWSVNSREHRLTPWSNDPVVDPHGEAFYLRDQESGRTWSPMPGPMPSGEPYETRHGFGYTRFVHRCEGIVQDTCLFVPPHDPVKVVRLRLTNLGARPRRLSLVSFQRLILGSSPRSARSVVTSAVGEGRDILLARNRLAPDFAERVAFATVASPANVSSVRVSGDAEAFLGPAGDPARPAALLEGGMLDGRTGAGLEPAFAIEVTLVLPPGETVECAFLLGEGESESAALVLAARYRASGAIDSAFDEATAFWNDLLTGVQIQTPSPALDCMVNGWLIYQTVACRLWGRSAGYQSGGAFGYRDQLQDAAALIPLRPELVRSQILLHASHQFVAGDVLHWWHPPLGRGLRTRFADDLLWLPYLTAHFVQSTGDWSLLDERAPYLDARALEPGEDEAYLLPSEAGESGDLYQHCCRAIDRSLAVGRHGLPLFGSGDWNDGMNRVGREGRGESVWMGFFLYAVLGDFLPICERRADRDRAHRYSEHRERLKQALHEAGWDGAWYRRAYDDAGVPIGSRDSEECRIDGLVQAWAVISGAAPRERAEQALDAVERHLISESEGIIRLLTPPFDHTSQDPGYIKGYVPGVRENGGQYTHAALWVVRALAELGRTERAARLLEMLAPVHHARTPEQVARYQVEPYVVAADVYGAAPHVGRGGWTWYTGSAAWMHRVALESVLGIRFEAGAALVIRPCIPAAWPRYRVSLRLPGENTRYEIMVQNPDNVSGMVVEARADGAPVPIEDGAARVPLRRDGELHSVEIVLGQNGAARETDDGAVAAVSVVMEGSTESEPRGR
ncbi:MAG TPA: glycosyl transferase, partial [Candidatus Limnocylindria bacterium]|nr:glycosyl transferase [Candidatus Limnocylindria bacterium]